MADLLICLLCYLLLPLQGLALSELEVLPVVSEGRIRPLGAVREESLYFVVPARNGDWLSLDALASQRNRTAYSTDTYQRLQMAYLSHPDLKQMTPHLLAAYKELAGRAYRKACGKALTYPTERQLRAELLYYAFPWIALTSALYLSAAIGLGLALGKRRWFKCSIPILIAAFACHTAILALRCYVLQRPPVSNMFETVIYVPWIAVIASLLLRRGPLLPFAASIVSIVLLTILQVMKLNEPMQPVQPVLDSQFWLIIHVLMIVGSYGTFLLSGVLGHFYLVQYARKRASPELATSVLHTMYLGTALLIPGTILGGVWAAQSWGRFWDWDPKEAWAFVTACTYLLCIHAYTFRKIGDLGLAVGSVIGLMIVSFTWYGVNYILGTGLHSYGFGSGGEFYYYGYLIAEVLFLTLCVFPALAYVEKK